MPRTSYILFELIIIQSSTNMAARKALIFEDYMWTAIKLDNTLQLHRLLPFDLTHRYSGLYSMKECIVYECRIRYPPKVCKMWMYYITHFLNVKCKSFMLHNTRNISRWNFILQIRRTECIVLKCQITYSLNKWRCYITIPSKLKHTMEVSY